MPRRDANSGAPLAETACRTIHAAFRTVAGDDCGSRVANKVTGALGLGRIKFCDDPNCLDCAPAK